MHALLLCRLLLGLDDSLQHMSVCKCHQKHTTLAVKMEEEQNYDLHTCLHAEWFTFVASIAWVGGLYLSTAEVLSNLSSLLVWVRRRITVSDRLSSPLLPFFLSPLLSPSPHTPLPHPLLPHPPLLHPLLPHLLLTLPSPFPPLTPAVS